MADLSERLAALPPEKQAFLALRMKQEGIDLPPDYILPVPRNGESYPLSFSQERLWFFNKLAPGNPVYNLPVALRIDGNLRVDLLHRSIDEIVRRHEALRLTFTEVDDEPRQIVQEPEPTALPILDFRHLSSERRESLVEEVAAASARRSFNLRTGPLIAFALLRLAPDEHVLLLVVHHIVSDGWSAGVFVRELAALYGAYAAGERPQLPDLPVHFLDYVLWQRGRVEDGAFEQAVAFWKERLAGAPNILELPGDRPRPPVQSFQGSTVSRTVSRSLSAKFRDLCRREGVTLFMGLVAAFQALLARYTGREDIVIGTPVAGRDQRHTGDLIGFFVNTLVLRTSLAGDPTVRQLLQRVSETVLEAFAYQEIPFEQIVEAVRPERVLSHTPIFQIAFVLQNAPMQALQLPDVQIEPLQIDGGVAKFDLHLDVVETGDGLKLTIEYSSDLFDSPTIERMMAHYERLLLGFIAGPDEPVWGIELLSSEERLRILRTWNETDRPYPTTGVHALVAEQAAAAPSAVAIVEGDRQVTYGQLMAGASRLAHLLQARGVRRGDRIGIYLERGAELIEALLAVLAAGAAYVPLDMSYPAERLALMAEDGDLAFVLTHEDLAGDLPIAPDKTLALDTLAAELRRYPADAPCVTVAPDDLAYIIYTSGSTGRPKGVSVPHRGIVRLVRETNYIEITTDHCLAQASNVSFDAATFEIWGALANGARLVFIPRQVALNPRELKVLLEQEDVTTLFLTTALFNQIARVAPKAFAGLQDVLFGGEAVDPTYVRRVLEHAPPERLLHVYGPTENTTYSTWFEVTNVADGATTVPIGRPLGNDKIYVLDEEMRPLPEGIPGELYVGGAGLAWGYHRRPALTAQRFVPDPFASDPGRRLYRTGDLVRWCGEGEIEFIGRIDHQVKLRGFRIELAEIEIVLGQHPAVEESVVLLREDAPGDRRLVGYIVLHAAPEVAGRPLPDEEALRNYLKERLPEYMVPSRFVLLDNLPLNPNGKIDRKALPRPDQATGREAGAYAPPVTPAEKTLAAIYARALNVERMGRHDNFFEMGGDSIKAIQVANAAEQAGLALSTKQIFQHQTVAELAQIAAPEEPAQKERRPRALPLLPAVVQLREVEPGRLQQAYQAFLFESDDSLDVKALQGAFDALLQRHEALSAPFSGEAPVQGGDVPAIAVHAFTDVADDGRQEARVRELAAELNVDGGPLLAAAVLRDAGQRDRLLLIGHELTLDADSWRVVAQDLALAYSQIRGEQPVQIPASADLSRVAEAFQAHLVSDAVVAELAQWQEEARAADGQSDHAPRPASYQTLVTEYDAEHTAACLQTLPAAYHLDVDELLALSLAWALHQAHPVPDVRLALVRRNLQGIEELATVRAVGPLATTYPVTLPMPAGPLPAALPALKESLRKESAPALALVLGQTMADDAMRRSLAPLPRPDVRLRYCPLPQTDGSLVARANVTPAGAAAGPYPLEICAAIRYDRLTLRCSFDSDHFSTEEVEQLLYGVRQALGELMAHYEADGEGAYTPSDFPMAQLDARELNALLNTLNRTGRT